MLAPVLWVTVTPGMRRLTWQRRALIGLWSVLVFVAAFIGLVSLIGPWAVLAAIGLGWFGATCVSQWVADDRQLQLVDARREAAAEGLEQDRLEAVES